MTFEETKKQAEQGNAHAQSNLGELYEKGEGVPQDYKEAVKWFRLSAGQGDVEGELNLGMMYAKGLGLPQDKVKAREWYTKGESQIEK